MKILLVDDEPIIIEFLYEYLTTFRQFDVNTASNGADALQMFLRNTDTYDVIISDIQMPEMDGVRFIERVRESSNIPVIVLTGYCDDNQRRRLSSLNIASTLAKPCDLASVGVAIDTILINDKNSDSMAQRKCVIPHKQNERLLAENE